MGVRLRAAVALSVGAGLALAPAGASAEAASSSPSRAVQAVPDPHCVNGGLYPTFQQSSPMATRPGEKVDVFQPWRNTGTAARRNTTFGLEVLAPSNKWRYDPPTIWWRVDHGGWHRMHFSWIPASGINSAVWYVQALPLGTFAPGQTHTLELSYSFTRNDAKGLYAGFVTTSTGICWDAKDREMGITFDGAVNDPGGH